MAQAPSRKRKCSRRLPGAGTFSINLAEVSDFNAVETLPELMVSSSGSDDDERHDEGGHRDDGHGLRW